jgi:hypothetical protein
MSLTDVLLINMTSFVTQMIDQWLAEVDARLDTLTRLKAWLECERMNLGLASRPTPAVRKRGRPPGSKNKHTSARSDSEERKT